MTFTKSNLTNTARKHQGRIQRNHRWANYTGLFDGWEG